MRGVFVFLVCVVMYGMAANQCNIPLPKGMDLETFRDKIEDHILTEIYVLNESPLSFTFHTKLIMREDPARPDTHVLFSCAGREGFDTSAGNCTSTIDFEFEIVGDGRAVFDVVGTNLTVFLWSDRPENYVLEVGCMEVDQTLGCCTGDYFVVLMSRGDTPDGFPWRQIEKNIRSDVKLTLDDDRFIFRRVLLECPNEI